MTLKSIGFWVLLILGWVSTVTFLVLFVVYYLRGRADDAISPPAQQPRSIPPSKKYFLATLTIAKNEALVIRDFIKHNQDQGVDHMYLIDNGSQDHMVGELTPYIQQGYITLFSRPEQHRQADHYNAVLPEIRTECEWLAVIDVDEYLYGRLKPLRAVIQEDLPDHHYLQVNMIVFGSSGHRQHPGNVREHFVHRFPDGQVWSRTRDTRKAIVRTDRVRSLGIHEHQGDFEVYPVPPELVHFNHYVIMSWEYFERVKMTRGDVYNANWNFRNQAYFDKVDLLATQEDTELRDLARYGYGSTCASPRNKRVERDTSGSHILGSSERGTPGAIERTSDTPCV